MKDIFLSAGVPGPEDNPYCQTADPLLIHSAVRSLCTLVFGHKRIIWGGHPAITPMMWAACENLGIDYAKTVHLYQSKFFDEYFPEENRMFGNVTYIEARSTREASLAAMRTAMMQHPYEVGVFIGGKDGVELEFKMFRKAHRNAKIAVFPSTGGAARMIGERYPELSAPMADFIDFTSYLASVIHIDSPRKTGGRKRRNRRRNS